MVVEVAVVVIDGDDVTSMAMGVLLVVVGGGMEGSAMAA